MGKANFVPKFGAISLAQQAGRMASKFPQLRFRLDRNTAIWTGYWLPSPLSDTYQLRISCQLPRRPKIQIISPQLKLAAGKTKLPHVYKEGQLDICVHRPEEWNKHLYIADTIMPWISQWLRFYEYWEQTGNWEGKGTHPENTSHRSREDPAQAERDGKERT
jgi:hypothetical protein